jgi:hypothetical protein
MGKPASYETPQKDVDAATFREAVNLYVQLSNEITKVTKMMTQYKRQRDALGQTIMIYMKSNSIDECHIDGEEKKLIRRQSKRTETLKKDEIIKAFTSALNGDEPRALMLVTNLFNNRVVNFKDALSLRKA